jgi:hypothetical protein
MINVEEVSDELDCMVNDHAIPQKAPFISFFHKAA